MEERSLRQRMGDRFLYYRHQVKGWKTVHGASIAMNKAINDSTIEDIESGGGNPRWDSFENYAAGLGIPFERILREALQPVSGNAALDPESRALLEIFAQLTDVKDRRRLIDMADHSLAGQRLNASTSEPPIEGDRAPQATAIEGRGPKKRSRGRR